MSLTFDEMERRVLGSLIEKAATQPDYYPMTLTALTAACNQKSNRNPVMDLSERAIEETLKGLRERKCIIDVAPAPGARSYRYRHNIEAITAWGPREKAVMTELMLRGPQTTGELRTRCARFFEFEDTNAVKMTLEALAAEEPPLVAELPRAPGQAATRYTHLLAPEGEETPETQATPTPAPTIAAAPAVATPTPSSEVTELKVEIAQMRETIEALTQRVTDLEALL